VFCGSSPGADPGYLQAAADLGHTLVKRGYGLVYGGANVGTMGQLASTVMAEGGEVIGVMPEGLVKKEVAHKELQDLRVVQTMHELSGGFIGLPGGLGTLEEFFEALAWAQLGIHEKPCAVLNINKFYDNILNFLDHAVTEQFMQAGHREMLIIDTDPNTLLDKFETYKPPALDKADWIKKLHSKQE